MQLNEEELIIIESLRYEDLELKDIQFSLNKSYKSTYRIICKLKELGFVKMYKKGFPPKTYYQLKT